MSRKPTLLLDVMGTLVYDPFFIEVPAHFGMSLRQLINGKDLHAWPAFERNEIGEEEFFARFFTDGRAIDGAKMKECMRKNYRFLDGTEALLTELHSLGYPLYALSNYPHWYQMIEEKLKLSRFLDWSFVSCHMGVRKPDAKAYLIPAQSLKTEPMDCIFVDDRKENCMAAEAVGMRSILFQSTVQLRRELIKSGVELG